ncbi:spore coat protein [Salipaludibacillus sp. CUR1]|uniref:CotD family spore coat protein n=1 Tax=Salipaludibacillus sp. CUR1 TaxID=2820003 RepID=UPI001E503ABF|nr:CotD family spore coat protein [Salipaludibacillus sp. CUR1]MCE7792348.1 spore coat protein [Salipaludibacillus sp. CUR1]
MFGRRHCTKPQVLGTQVCPTKQRVRNFQCDYIVPVVHPSHTTNVVNHRYNFQHSYPHTESRVDRIQNFHTMAGPGPGQVAGAATGPFGPGMGPGMVAGAQMGPWGHQKKCGW